MLVHHSPITFILTSTMGLQTTVAGIPLDCCIYNASGPRTGSTAALMKIGMSRAGA